jgi:type IV pilus assembly protein PilC
MVEAGVAMLRALTIMVDQCENPKLKRALDAVKKNVESGGNLSDALAKYPDIFDKLYVAMVRAGEAGGILDKVLKRLADFMEAREKLNGKVKGAMAYPVVAMTIAVAVFWGMLTFILPIFQKMFKQMGAELPAFTQFLIMLSEIMRSIWMLIAVIAIGGAGYALKQYYATDQGQLVIDGILLKMPLIGDLNRKVAIARFTRTFGTLITSGVPMLQALDVVKDTAGNAVLVKSVLKIANDVRQGSTITGPLSKDPLFPPMVSQMLAVGEETGRLDEMLEKIADFYDNEVEQAVEAITSAMEPLMVVGIGGIVGSVVVGMYLPIFSIITNIK